MSYTEHPDIDAARHMEDEERKALELEWLIEEESKKECYNPFLIENIVEALCNLSDANADDLQQELNDAKDVYKDWGKWYMEANVFHRVLESVVVVSEVHQEKRIIENVMKGK